MNDPEESVYFTKTSTLGGNFVAGKEGREKTDPQSRIVVDSPASTPVSAVVTAHPTHIHLQRCSLQVTEKKLCKEQTNSSRGAKAHLFSLGMFN